MKKALLIITTLALIIGTLMQTMPVGANPTDDPKTKITLTVSPETISPGETVKLTISEENTGNAAITSVRVEVTGGAVFTLTSNNGTNPPDTVFSGDNSNDGILFPSEKWTWVVPFMAGTENYFTATGHGDYTYFDWSTRKYVTVDITPTPDPQNPLNTLYPDETDTKTVTLSLTASLGDFVWYDVNANGIQDTGEPVVPGVKVELYNGSPAPLRTTTTDGNGKYLFSDLLPGSYSVKFYLPAGYIFTLKDQGSDDGLDSDANINGETVVTTLESGENDLTWDAGLVKPGTLKIYKFWDKDGDKGQDCDEPYLSGWVFNIVGPNGYTGTGTTNSSGCIKIENLVPGNYTVTEVVQDGWVVTTANPQTATVVAVQTAYLYFGNKKISPGTLKIYKFEDKDGDKEKDWNESYLSGWVFNIVGPDGYTSAGTTNSSGYIKIENLVPGNYTVTEVVQAGWVVTTNNPQTATVIAGQTATLKFGNKKTSPGTLKIYKFEDKDGDKEQDCDEPYLSGWVFNIVGPNGYTGTGTTNSSGYIKIENLVPGNYTVTEVVQAGWVVTTANPQTATVVAGQTATLKFGNKKASPGTLKIYKFWDKDGDKGQDCDEPYLSGWVFNVVGPDGYTGSGTTNSSGYIKIENLVPGNYTVTEVVQAGWVVTTANPQTATVVAGKTAYLYFGNKKK